MLQEERAAALATAQAAQKEAERQLAAARQARADAAAAGVAVEGRAAEVERAAQAAEQRAAAAEAEMEALQREHQDRQKRCVLPSGCWILRVYWYTKEHTRSIRVCEILLLTQW